MQPEASVISTNFEYHGSDKIHTLSMSMACAFLIGIASYFERGIEAGIFAFALMGATVLAIVVPILMRNRQDEVVVDGTNKECHAKSRRLFLPDQVTKFGRDEIVVIGAMEYYGDGGPFYRPVVRTKSGHEFAIGADAISAAQVHAKAKEFSESLGLRYQEIVFPEF